MSTADHEPVHDDAMTHDGSDKKDDETAAIVASPQLFVVGPLMPSAEEQANAASTTGGFSIGTSSSPQESASASTVGSTNGNVYMPRKVRSNSRLEGLRTGSSSGNLFSLRRTSSSGAKRSPKKRRSQLLPSDNDRSRSMRSLYANQRDGSFSQSPSSRRLNQDTFQHLRDELAESQKKRRQSVDMKRKDLAVDCLLWFSQHIPRTVLEDLVQQEIHEEQNRKSGSQALADAASKLTLDDSMLTILNEERAAMAARQQQRHHQQSQAQHLLPDDLHLSPRESAILFLDISGFTRLSTLLDVESLTLAINTYFDLLVSEVIRHGGDILKFAGDAFFAEWKVSNHTNNGHSHHHYTNNNTTAEQLLAPCVLKAAQCAASIVAKFSDYKVTTPVGLEPTLNVHCGIGCGSLMGLHVGDDDNDKGIIGEVEEQILHSSASHHSDASDDKEQHREFLVLGEPIDQVSQAEGMASNGEVYISKQAVMALQHVCAVQPEILQSTSPAVCLASRNETMIAIGSRNVGKSKKCGNVAMMQMGGDSDDDSDDIVVPTQEELSLRRQCLKLDRGVLTRLIDQISLYLHPTVREAELAHSAAIREGGHDHLLDTRKRIQKRHIEEAELRSVYTIFIKPLISPVLVGVAEVDQQLFHKLQGIMKFVLRVLNQYSGHLQQFIVDDKGVVLLATFGLRGSKFPNMVANNGLPATLAIHQGLKAELNIDSRIGATYGKIYCGIVGGLRRHSFNIIGAPVNLAARLMASSMNKGILVDECVVAQAETSTTCQVEFRGLPPINAKGYAKPVAVLEPLLTIDSASERFKITKSTQSFFVGRKEELHQIGSVAREFLSPSCSAWSGTILVLTGESGIGKSSLGLKALDQVKIVCAANRRKWFGARATSSETGHRAPLSTFWKVFTTAITELCSSKTGNVQSTRRPSQQLQSPRGRRRSGQNGYPKSPTKEETTKRAYTKFANLALDSSRVRIHGRSGSVGQWGHDSMASGADAMDASNESWASRRTTTKNTHTRYFEKLCWICLEIGYPNEYAHYVGSQFLGLDGANVVTQFEDGEPPEVEELVQFLVTAFTFLTKSVDLTFVFLDEFQWVDSFSWSVFRELAQNGGRFILVCAVGLHGKEATQRLTALAASNPDLPISEILLGPLNLFDVRELISRMFGVSEEFVDDSLCADVYQRTGGLSVHLVGLIDKIRREKSVAVDHSGYLRWTIEAAESQLEATSHYTSNAVMEELFQGHFDCLDATVRKVLQACAVLGLSFCLSDIIRLHPELDLNDVQQALEIGVREIILIERIEGGEVRDVSAVDLESSLEYMTLDGPEEIQDRDFEFSHSMWRESVLKTMLKERKEELHRKIADEMEKDQLQFSEQSEIARLIKTFDYWKEYGDFCKCAKLALSIGSKLDDLGAIALYGDALSLADEEMLESEGVGSAGTDQSGDGSAVVLLDLTLRLRMRIGLCHLRRGDSSSSMEAFETAYQALFTRSEIPERCLPLVLPILATLCPLKIEDEDGTEETHEKVNRLILNFVNKAREQGDPVHVCRALSMMSMYYAKHGNFERALAVLAELNDIYDMEKHSADIIELYGQNYPLHCYCESVQWCYIVEMLEEADSRATVVVQDLVPRQNHSDLGNMVMMTLPVIQVLALLGRPNDADAIFKKCVIDSFHNDDSAEAQYWEPIFTPLAYLLELMKMEQNDEIDASLLREIENWVLTDEHSIFHPDLQNRGHTWMGELMLRLAKLKDEDDPAIEVLLQRATHFLSPVAQQDSDIFNKLKAGALLGGIEVVATGASK